MFILNNVACYNAENDIASSNSSSLKMAVSTRPVIAILNSYGCAIIIIIMESSLVIDKREIFLDFIDNHDFAALTKKRDAAFILKEKISLNENLEVAAFNKRKVIAEMASCNVRLAIKLTTERKQSSDEAHRKERKWSETLRSITKNTIKRKKNDKTPNSEVSQDYCWESCLPNPYRTMG